MYMYTRLYLGSTAATGSVGARSAQACLQAVFVLLKVRNLTLPAITALKLPKPQIAEAKQLTSSWNSEIKILEGSHCYEPHGKINKDWKTKHRPGVCILWFWLPVSVCCSLQQFSSHSCHTNEGKKRSSGPLETTASGDGSWPNHECTTFIGSSCLLKLFIVLRNFPDF